MSFKGFRQINTIRQLTIITLVQFQSITTIPKTYPTLICIQAHSQPSLSKLLSAFCQYRFFSSVTLHSEVYIKYSLLHLTSFAYLACSRGTITLQHLSVVFYSLLSKMLDECIIFFLLFVLGLFPDTGHQDQCCCEYQPPAFMGTYICVSSEQVPKNGITKSNDKCVYLLRNQQTSKTVIQVMWWFE